MCVCLRATQEGRTSLVPDWQRGSVPPLYFRLPLFLSAATSCPAPRRRQGCVGSQSHGLNHRKRHQSRMYVCVCVAEGEFVCLQNNIDKLCWEEAEFSTSRISYRSLLIEFLAAVGHCGESGWWMLGCTNNELKELVSCLVSFRESCLCCNCLYNVGVSRSWAGVILEVWIVNHFIFILIFLSGKMFL